MKRWEIFIKKNLIVGHATAKVTEYKAHFLALGMKIFVSVLALVCMAYACGSNDKSDSLLKSPTYAALTDSLQEAPQDPTLYYKRGVLLYQNEQYAYAQNDLQKAWELLPNEQHALSLATLLSKKHPDSTLAFLQTARNALPQSVAIQVRMAKSWQAKSEHRKALEITTAILQQHPNSIDALLLQAELLRAMNQPAAALTALERAYTLAPFDPEIVHNLAFEYAEAKNSKVLALADSLILSDINAIHAEPYFFKGLYFENTGNIQEALKQMDAAISHDYYFLDAHMEKGQILYNEKRYADALKAFQLANTISPSFGEAFLWLGKTKEALGNKAEAKLDYQRAYGLDKTLTEAKAAADRL